MAVAISDSEVLLTSAQRSQLTVSHPESIGAHPGVTKPRSVLRKPYFLFEVERQLCTFARQEER